MSDNSETRRVPIGDNGDEVMERPAVLNSLESQTRGEIDIQISTAKRYPRSIKQFRQAALEMATLDEATAESCIYALPRDGKTVAGPSARMAEIVASAWGHMRVEARIVQETDRFVVAKGVAWDLQSNVAIAFEVRRRITNRRGEKFSDDMIVVTSNAAASIALRNAVLKVVPPAMWRTVYDQCRLVAIGDAKTLATRRADMMSYFGKMGIVPDQVYAVLGVKGVEDITLDHMATLKGLATAIKDGDTTIEEAFAAPTPARGSDINRVVAEMPAAEPTPVPQPQTEPKPDLGEQLKQSVDAEQAKAGRTFADEMADAMDRVKTTRRNGGKGGAA